MKPESLNEPWRKVAARRRSVLFFLVLVPSFTAAFTMAGQLPHRGATLLELAIIVVFCLLFIWISLGFWTAMAGFWTLLKRTDRFAISRLRQAHDEPIREHVRTAILFPVCNEEPARVMAGIQAVWKSLERVGGTKSFDIHILSDTTDPDRWIQEEAAWDRLCTLLNARGHIFYRRRRHNQKRKSGNVADFCRRYGVNYTYMIVFDADSIMSGTTLLKLVQIMERRRNVGIVQTAPACAEAETLIGRAQQFANRAYGPLYTAGLHHWFLGDAQFWGHNAIIRMEPFLKHCALSRLPGKPPLGGDILSHDFVESALMRRAGYAVWLAYDLPGSYEEVPPNLLNELKRDRRWCQGNLQHLRLVFTKGIFAGHRVLFLNGVMSYGSALLWFLFLALGTAEAIVESVVPPTYFAQTKTLFPVWPQWSPRPALTLLGATAIVLFLPKFCALIMALIQKRRKQFGGFFALSASIAAEVLLSTLLAPVRMLFHSKYVFLTLIGCGIGWNTQQRDSTGTSFRDALRFHGSGTLLGLLWGATMFIINRTFFWWSSPLVFSLLLSIPVSMISSRFEMGSLFRRLHLFITPEEKQKPQEYEDVEKFFKDTPSTGAFGIKSEDGFTRAVVDPHVHLLHLALLRGPHSVGEDIRSRRNALAQKALENGPENLTAKEKKELLMDPNELVWLHRNVWRLPEPALTERWKVHLR